MDLICVLKIERINMSRGHVFQYILEVLYRDKIEI